MPNTKILIIKSRYERFKAKFTYTVLPLLFIPPSIMDISLHPTGLEKSLYSSLSFKQLLAPIILFAKTFALLNDFLDQRGKGLIKLLSQQENLLVRDDQTGLFSRPLPELRNFIQQLPLYYRHLCKADTALSLWCLYQGGLTVYHLPCLHGFS